MHQATRSRSEPGRGRASRQRSRPPTNEATRSRSEPESASRLAPRPPQNRPSTAVDNQDTPSRPIQLTGRRAPRLPAPASRTGAPPPAVIPAPASRTGAPPPPAIVPAAPSRSASSHTAIVADAGSRSASPHSAILAEAGIRTESPHPSVIPGATSRTASPHPLAVPPARPRPLAWAPPRQAVAIAMALALALALGGPAATRARTSANRPASLAAVAPDATAALQTAPSQSPNQDPSIAVLGVGEATAPAVSGRLQLILRAADPFAAVAADAPAALSGQPPALTTAQIRPVRDAIAAAGATSRRVEAVPGPPAGGPFGSGAAQILIDLDRTTLPLADEMVAAGLAAAGENGLLVESVGAGFLAADCAGLLDEARRAAAADARQRAEGVAAAFDVELGDLLLINEVPFYDGASGFGCAPAAGAGQTGIYFPPFDPTSPPTVAVYAQLNVSYAIAS